MLGVLVAALLIAYLIHELYWKRRRLPPGPTPLPLIGNVVGILSGGEPGYLAYVEWRKQFGPVYTVWLAGLPIVVIADYATMKETIIKDAENYAERFTPPFTIEFMRNGPYGIIDANDALWRDSRRLGLHILRDFGMGKEGMQQRVLEEVAAMVTGMTKLVRKGEHIQPQQFFDVAVGSVINQLLFGYRFDEEHMSEFNYIKARLSEQVSLLNNPLAFLMVVYPSLKALPLYSSLFAKFRSNNDLIFGFLRNQIQAHKSDIDWSTDDATDICEKLLKEQKARENTPHDTFNDLHIENVCFDMWAAGMETTSNTLAWFTLYMIHNPDAQEKMAAELKQKVGVSAEYATMEHRPSLHYTNAVIAETQRCANLLPSNLFRRAKNDVVIGDYKVAAGTIVLPQISSVLLDEQAFPEPLIFKPERFLDASGHFATKEELVPFSVGRRQCLGEGLARLELFLFGANLVRRFKISAIDPSNPPSLRKRFGGTVQPINFNCKFELRAQ